VTDSEPTRRRPTPDEFASMVTHELRNPLNALAGWLHLIGADPAMKSDLGERAIAGARRALEQQLLQVDMVGQLLRLSQGAEPPAPEPVDLRAVVETELRAQSASAEDGGHAVRWRERPGEHTDGRADDGRGAQAQRVIINRALLESSLRALVTFALRHGAPGAPLEVSVSNEDRMVALVLRIDEGEDAGLSIWHAFGQSGSRLALDLYLAMLAIESYGGMVRPRPSVMGGDELHIRLPVASDDDVSRSSNPAGS
jgi:signal transduction histidine kinase